MEDVFNNRLKRRIGDMLEGLKFGISQKAFVEPLV